MFKDFRYQSLESWSCERRVVGKAEYLAKGENPRFIVTSVSIEEQAGRRLYEDFYCACGDMENRIKEQQLDLFADRTSTQAMRSNQLRLYFSSFAYVLVQTLRRLGLDGTELAKAQCATIRLKLFKIGAQVRVSVRLVPPSRVTEYILRMRRIQPCSQPPCEKTGLEIGRSRPTPAPQFYLLGLLLCRQSRSRLAPGPDDLGTVSQARTRHRHEDLSGLGWGAADHRSCASCARGVSASPHVIASKTRW